MISRRSFLGSILALGAAPSIGATWVQNEPVQYGTLYSAHECFDPVMPAYLRERVTTQMHLDVAALGGELVYVRYLWLPSTDRDARAYAGAEYGIRT